MSSAPGLSGAVLLHLTRELTQLQTKPSEGIRVWFNECLISDIQAEMDGPAGTPFEGGVFRLRIVIPADFPSVPPKCAFITKIFHPNVSASGEICVNVLKKDWTPDVGIRHVLLVIRCLLIEPFPESALNEEAGKLLLNNYDEYDRHARLMTAIHAPAPKGPLTTSGANAGCPGAAPPSSDALKKEESTSPVKKGKPTVDQANVSSLATSKQQGQVMGSKLKKSLKRL